MTTVAATEVRWRITGDAPGEAPWIVRRFPVGVPIVIAELDRGAEVECEIRNIGTNGRASAWVPSTLTVATTNRTGALALPTNVVANQASMWDVDTSVTYEAESDAGGASEATISVSAGTLVIGGRTLSYGASSATLTGEAEEVRTVYLYYDDPRMQGGTRTLGVADNVVDTANVDGRVAITSLTLTFPEAGTTGGGGGGIGGGGGGGGAHNPNFNENPL